MKRNHTRFDTGIRSSFILRPSSLYSSAFTLVELLVVIGIIVILVAILLPAVSRVKIAARNAETTALLKDLAAAIENYNGVFHAYPGPFSNAQICNSISSGTSAGVIDPSNSKGYGNASMTSIPFATNPAVPPGFDTTTPPSFGSITMSENLVLGLLGGLQVDSTNNSNLVYNPSLIGNGPNTILVGNVNKHYEQYVTDQKHLNWSTNASGKTGRFQDELGIANDSVIPEFVDTYNDPLPILYLRAKKGAVATPPPASYDNTNNTIVTYDPNETGAAPFRVGQYDLHQIIGYTGAQIGTGRKPPTYVGWGPPTPTHGLSNEGAAKPIDVNETRTSRYPYGAYSYFRNQSLSSPADTDTTNYPNPSVNNARNDVPVQKDGFILISAGPDRVFGTNDDITNFGQVGQ